MAIDTMEDLLVHELRDLINAEKQLIKALPRMAKAATNDALVTAIEHHLEETRGQVARLEECFAHLGLKPRGKKCAGMEGLLQEAADMLEECDDEDVCDAAIIGSAQRVEHYEIAAYGTARAFALRLGQNEVADLLGATLDEESAADELLSQIAESQVNMAAPADDETADENTDERTVQVGSNGNLSHLRPDDGKHRGHNGMNKGSAIKPTRADRARSTASRQPPRRGLAAH